MRLKSISLRNFLSYGSTDFSFHNDPEERPSIYIISGINNDSSMSDDNSNGSGKSTLVGEAITFNIFGKNLRGSSKKIKLENTIKFGESSMVNEAEYYIDQSAVLKIRREKERDGKSSLSISVDGEKKTKRIKRLSETDIRDFLGIDPEVYYQTISYYKDNVGLLAMNYSQRLDFFKKLVNLSIIDKYYQFCKKYKTDIEMKIHTTAERKKAQEAILDAITNDNTQYQSIILEAIAKLEEEIKSYEEIEEKSTDKYEEKLKQLEEATKKLEDRCAEIRQQNRSDASRVRELQREVADFEKLSNANCPTCGQLVSGEYAEGIIRDKSELIQSLTEQIKSREKEAEEYMKKVQKAKEKIDKIRVEIDSIRNENTVRRVKLQSLNKQLIEKKKELETVRKKMHTEDETNEYAKMIAKLEKIGELLERRQEINNFWLENLQAKSPVRSAIIRKHVNFLSDIFEYYLGKLFRNTIVGKMEIDDEGLIDVILQSDGHDVNYWNLSSGEKKRADLAMLFALYVYILNMVPNAPRFLVLDEIADSLDQPGIDAVCETILDLFLNYQIDTFIISHIPLREDVFAGKADVKKIMVVKQDGNSIAEYYIDGGK